MSKWRSERDNALMVDSCPRGAGTLTENCNFEVLQPKALLLCFVAKPSRLGNLQQAVLRVTVALPRQPYQKLTIEAVHHRRAVFPFLRQSFLLAITLVDWHAWHGAWHVNSSGTSS